MEIIELLVHFSTAKTLARPLSRSKSTF
jgi:hypothetical protein